MPYADGGDGVVEGVDRVERVGRWNAVVDAESVGLEFATLVTDEAAATGGRVGHGGDAAVSVDGGGRGPVRDVPELEAAVERAGDGQPHRFGRPAGQRRDAAGQVQRVGR